jgi:hypothetical protein
MVGEHGSQRGPGRRGAGLVLVLCALGWLGCLSCGAAWAAEAGSPVIGSTGSVVDAHVTIGASNPVGLPTAYEISLQCGGRVGCRLNGRAGEGNCLATTRSTKSRWMSPGSHRASTGSLSVRPMLQVKHHRQGTWKRILLLVNARAGATRSNPTNQKSPKKAGKRSATWR